MSYPHLATRLYNAPLLLTPGKAEVIEQVFRAHNEGRAALLTPSPTAPRKELDAPGLSKSDAGYYRTSTGIALIPIVGTLVQRGDSMDAASGLVGYNRIASQLQAAVDDPRADAILLEIDSNGGEAAGVMDLAAKISEAKKRKPTWAIANEGAFSAAYWLASASDRISAPESGMVGSIGVVMLHADQSVKDAKQGITYTPIYAGDRKVDFSSHAPLSDAALAIAQDEVNRVYDLFVAAVATGRGMESQAVRDTQAGLFHAKAAAELGLIDAVESFDATLMALAVEAQRFRVYGPRAATSARATIGDLTMTANADKPAAPAGAVTEQLVEAQKRGFDEGKAAVDTTAIAKAAIAEDRKRVVAIQSCEAAKGKPALASHLALETDMTVEQATALLAKAAVEVPAKSNPLSALMPANPKVAADAGNADEPPKKTIDAAKIYAARRLAPVK